MPSEACPATPFPIATASCSCQTSVGGVNDLYFIPCSKILSEPNILDVDFWEDMKTGSGEPVSLGSIGVGRGSIAKKSDKKDRLGSCKVEQLISTTWALKYVLKCFDKSVSKVTHAQINALINNAGNYQLVARMCDGDNTLLPIGPMVLSDFNWTVPDNFEELQTIEIEVSWVETALPKTYDVPGLSAVLPKAA